MPRRCDIWRVGIVAAPVERIAAAGLTSDLPIRWLDVGRSFTFDADPFGIWQDDRLHLFVEHYDYRTRRGAIDHLALDGHYRVTRRTRVLEEPWHLSYPHVFAADGAIWMLPEAYRSGTLTLYRARAFPHDWEAVARLPLDGAAIDATPFFHEGRWWLFYSSAGDRLHRTGSLHVAWAERLTGPWTLLQPGPVRLDRAGARPGGRPFLLDGGIVLPVQDCSRTYGGAIRLLHVNRLDPGGITLRPGRILAPDPAWRPFDAGLHTLDGCGPVTLIDAKRIDRSGRGWLIDAGRWFRSRSGREAAP
ncbi:glucosamine inositolphosphorylceramide transferase family protein [Flavisphingomonas formosensis]|uniref:glucosamine inositolphosphorylceramide transferase family protein n=1 Tax=Flavisphingomonas formosensis TaxID=861534 RepID=UPI0018DF658D|nr:formyl transferase [Sphingomonas formosensis]